MNNPWLVILMTAAGLGVAKLWQDDYVAARENRPHPRALPGVAPVSKRALGIAVAGALLLVAAETGGEYALGIAHEQSRMTWLFAFYSVAAAPFVEETIFRGWLVFDRRGPAFAWAGAVAMSVVFAALHPFLWQWNEDGFAFTLGLKAGYSTAAVFATSLWFYAVRLARWNPTRSLLPCFAAHAAKNAAVVGVKATTGFMGPWW